MNAKLKEQLVRGDLVSLVDAAHPADHGPIVSPQALEVGSIWAPCFATMEHGRADTCLVDLAADLRGKVAGREDRQKFPELSPRHTTPGSDGGIATTTGVQHVPEIAELVNCLKQGTININFGDWATIDGNKAVLL